MSADRSSVSQTQTYQAMGEFWDTHDATLFGEQIEPVEFEVDIQSEVIYYAIDRELSAQMAELARRRGVSAETLLNLWVQEKVSATEN